MRCFTFNNSFGLQLLEQDFCTNLENQTKIYLCTCSMFNLYSMNEFRFRPLKNKVCNFLFYNS